MRAIVVHEPGGPEVLRLEQVPEPTPNGNVLVRIEAAGINHFDINQRSAPESVGSTPPFIPGIDGAGTRLDTGERVLVTGTPGTYAEGFVSPLESLHAIPDALDTVQAAALGVT